MGKMTAKVEVYVPDDVKRRLAELSERTRVPVAVWVREGIEMRLDAAERAEALVSPGAET
jgi:predicted DNA-binding protein